MNISNTPPSQRSHLLRDGAWCLVILGTLAALAIHGAVNNGYNWQWERVWPYFITNTGHGFAPGPLLTKGLACTLRISGQALVIALAVGLIATVLRLTGGPIARSCSIAYVQCVRNTPLMVQLIALYTLTPVSWGLSAENIAVIVLGLFEGAYMTEIFRAGVLAIPTGQWEAGRSLGLPTLPCWEKIILPQALRHCLPPLVSQCITLIKDSSLVGIIAVSDLAQQSGLAVSDTFLSFEIWLPVACIYLALALTLSSLALWLHRRLQCGVALPQHS